MGRGEEQKEEEKEEEDEKEKEEEEEEKEEEEEQEDKDEGKKKQRRSCAFVVCQKAAGQRRQHCGYCHAHYTNIYGSSSLLFCVHTHNRSSSAVAKSNGSPLMCHSSVHWVLGDQHTTNRDQLAGGYRHHIFSQEIFFPSHVPSSVRHFD